MAHALLHTRWGLQGGKMYQPKTNSKIFARVLCFSLVCMAVQVQAYSLFGFRWKRGVVDIVVDVPGYNVEAYEAISSWNEALAGSGVRLAPRPPTRRFLRGAHRAGDKVNSMYFGPTPNYADAVILKRGQWATEVDIRVSKDRFSGLPRDRVLIILKHEVGHLLGLNHFDGPLDSVMHSRLPFRIPGIMPDDRAGINALYK